MVAIAGGSFALGCTVADDPDCSTFLPPRTVSLADFAIDRDEVTVGAARACLAEPGCNEYVIQSPTGDDDDPVERVSVDWARAFCARRDARLPTVDEWERAARGADLERYPWGATTPTCDHAIFADCSGGPATVGIRPAGASAEGVLDLVGNVAEWVEHPAEEPYVPFMGGSYESPSTLSALTAWSDEDGVFIGWDAVGFRCARDL